MPYGWSGTALIVAHVSIAPEGLCVDGGTKKNNTSTYMIRMKIPGKNGQYPGTGRVQVMFYHC